MEEKLITLKCYDSILNAMFDKEILHTNNIESLIQNENAVELMPMFSEVYEGLRLVVFEKDLDAANSILEQYHALVDGE